MFSILNIQILIEKYILAKLKKTIHQFVLQTIRKRIISERLKIEDNVISLISYTVPEIKGK